MWGVIRKRAAENSPKSPNAVPLQLRSNQIYNYYYFQSLIVMINIYEILVNVK